MGFLKSFSQQILQMSLQVVSLQQIKKQTPKMSKLLKTAKWVPQEYRMLKELRQEQIQRNSVNWEIIAQILNKSFNSSPKTPKQCREKYINHARLEDVKVSNEWTQEQIQILCQLYQEYGPCWAFFSSKLTNRSQNNIKNKFNNGLRRISKILYKKQGQIYRHTKRSISTQMLISMMDFVYQLQKCITSQGLTPNYEGKLFRFRSQILRFSLKNQNLEGDELCNLVKLIKALNCKIRCFGIFKVKNRKTWKLSNKGLYTVLEFDKVMKEDYQFIAQYRLKQQCQAQKKTYTGSQQGSFSPQPLSAAQDFNLKEFQLESFQSFAEEAKGSNWFDLQKDLCDILGQSYIDNSGIQNLMI